MLIKYGYKETYDFLIKVKDTPNINSKIIFEHSSYNKLRDIYEKEISHIRDKIELKATAIACIFCNKKTVIAEPQQVRSNDEAPGVSYYCNSCGKKWFRG